LELAVDTAGGMIGSDKVKLGLGLGKFIRTLALFAPKAPVGLGLRLLMRDIGLVTPLRTPISGAGATTEIF